MSNLSSSGFQSPFWATISLYYDNDLTRYIVANPMFYKRTKHTKIDCHIVKEKLNKALIHLHSISTIEQVADIYTKALRPQSFKNICSKLGFINICSSACGKF